MPTLHQEPFLDLKIGCADRGSRASRIDNCSQSDWQPFEVQNLNGGVFGYLHFQPLDSILSILEKIEPTDSYFLIQLDTTPICRFSRTSLVDVTFIVGPRCGVCTQWSLARPAWCCFVGPRQHAGAPARTSVRLSVLGATAWTPCFHRPSGVGGAVGR